MAPFVRILLLTAAPILRTASAAPLPEPWAARGDEVEAADKAYEDRLERFHKTLTERIKEEAPELLPQAQQETPKPVDHGYQLLPKLLPNVAPPSPLPRAEVRAYSWPWTRTKIAREAEKLDSLEADFARARTAPAPERRARYKKILDAYAALPTGQVEIDSHIQYNRLWQASIAANRALYDRQTRLEGDVLERQKIRDELAAGKPGGRGGDSLRGREEALAREIHGATDEVVPPAFVVVEHPGPHAWIVRVPFITDIEDENFLRAFSRAVEESWRVTDGEDEYRAEVSFQRISTRRLYEGNAAPPKTGDPIDIAKHLALFPKGYAVLTTGATLTNVDAVRCIVIGTNEIKPHDLAHEFGHILGFKDVYFRGYKDLGGDGFEVQEIIAEPGDIMGAPGWGPVRKEHFARLIAAKAAGVESDVQAAMMASGLALLYEKHDPAAAAAQFRRVLERSPRHYGAAYQLAASLDQAGEEREAVAVWRTVLRMAEGDHDQATADAVRARLARPASRSGLQP